MFFLIFVLNGCEIRFYLNGLLHDDKKIKIKIKIEKGRKK